MKSTVSTAANAGQYAIVEQQAPTVVNQPAPTVVNQPDPTVVMQPPPVVVDPTVVNPVVIEIPAVSGAQLGP